MKDLASCVCPYCSHQTTALKVNVAQGRLVVAGDKVVVRTALNALRRVSVSIEEGRMIIAGRDVVITTQSSSLVVTGVNLGSEIKIGVRTEDKIVITIGLNVQRHSTVNIGGDQMVIASSRRSVLTATTKSNALDKIKMNMDRGRLKIGGVEIALTTAGSNVVYHVTCDKNI